MIASGTVLARAFQGNTTLAFVCLAIILIPFLYGLWDLFLRRRKAPLSRSRCRDLNQLFSHLTDRLAPSREGLVRSLVS